MLTYTQQLGLLHNYVLCVHTLCMYSMYCINHIFYLWWYTCLYADLMTLSDSQHFPTNLTEVILNGNSFVVREDGVLFASGPLTQVLTIVVSKQNPYEFASLYFQFLLRIRLNVLCLQCALNESPCKIIHPSNYGIFLSASILSATCSNSTWYTNN